VLKKTGIQFPGIIKVAVMNRSIGYLLLGALMLVALVGYSSAFNSCSFGGFGSSGVPDPFGDTGSGGVADPFDADAAGGVPCPFLQPGGTEGEVGIMDAAGQGTYPAPRDPDGDGAYEDLNGNGHTDFADVILYFQNMDWMRENQPQGSFDYNGNGLIDFNDLILLFQEV
jgi:PKD repeat protein